MIASLPLCLHYKLLRTGSKWQIHKCDGEGVTQTVGGYLRHSWGKIECLKVVNWGIQKSLPQIGGKQISQYISMQADITIIST